jgi:hypothetical protein
MPFWAWLLLGYAIPVVIIAATLVAAEFGYNEEHRWHAFTFSLLGCLLWGPILLLTIFVALHEKLTSWPDNPDDTGS